MPLYKRKPFSTKSPPKDLRPDEEIFYLKLTNEIFRDYDEYFQRVILCNSLVWSCSLTGKINLTYEEALDSEKRARKLLNGFPRPLKIALLYLTNQTHRGKVLDVCEDLFSYARDHYFKGEVVLGVIGNLWCHSRVVHIIPPTEREVELFKAEQMEKGELESNDYLKDDSWGPPPDLFRYEVEETDPDNPDAKEVHVLESIDVKREKTMITRDKCKVFIKHCTYYSEKDRAWRVKEDIWKSHSLDNVKFAEIFVGKCPIFESSLGPASKPAPKISASQSSKATPEIEGEVVKEKKKRNRSKSKPNSPDESSKKRRAKSNENEGKGKKKSTGNVKSNVENSKRKSGEPKPKKKKDAQVSPSPQEIKQLEFEKKLKDRETAKEHKKLVVDFKKLWFKPKEDLEVEDLKDIPAPDPVLCKIPNHLFGDFMMILEYFGCYSSLLKVRDCFPNGLGFDMMERALTKNEIAGPLSDILQLLLRAIFRLQESEDAEIAQDEKAAVELQIDETVDDVSAAEAIQQATAAATWSLMYQNTSLHKLTLDHLCLTEVLRLHLLVSGARVSEKDVKWRYQMRGGYTSHDDPGLQLRIEEPQILKTLSQGTVFDLTITEKIKLIQCLINQIMTYVSVRDTVEESFEQFKQARSNLRSLQAAEKHKEKEDHLWRQKLKADKAVPDANFMKAAVVATADDAPGLDKKIPSDTSKPLLSDEQIEALLLKRDKETAKRKQQFEWKAAEYTDIVNKHERKLGVHPIGRDRAFRRYWIFASLPGLFVEHDDDTVGPCLPSPTPYISEVNLEDMTFIKENIEKLKRQEREGSDKENGSVGSPKKVAKRKSASTPSKQEKEARPEVFGVCTGDEDSCPVHCTHLPRAKWYFYWNVEQLDDLIAGLSTRGIREKELRNVLLEEKSGIANLIQKCPVLKLNTQKKYPESVTQAPDRKPQRTGQGASKHSLDPNLNFPPGTTIETILELQLRDLILETEDKIFLGALGSLKIDDRGAWRRAIESRSYDKQTDELRWGESKSLSASSGKISGSTTPQDAGPSARSTRSKYEDAMSSEGSSSSGSGLGHSANSKDEIFLNPVIRELGSAILQLEQSIEPKFLKRPLGVDKEDPEKKKRAGGRSGENDSNVIKAKWLLGSARERWETSLMKSTSFPQLFMHLFTLDNSIEWTRSVLNARCRLCRRKGDAENMLLCDGCNKGHHAYCLKPALEVIPKGDWFCLDCKPPELLPRAARNGRKVFHTADASDEGSASEGENSGSEDNSDEDDDGPPVLRAADSVEIEVCEVCQSGGEVICCDGCPSVYHMECLNPPKTRVPRGSWYCDECSNSKKKGRKVTKPVLKKVLPQKNKYSSKISSDSEDDKAEEEDETIGDEEGETDAESNSEEDQASGQEDDEEASSASKGESAIKVKFGRTPRKPTYGTRSSTGQRKKYAQNGSNESEEEEEEGRESKRRYASQAANIKIAQVSKRLRSDSKENESSENSNDSNASSSTGGGRKRSFDSDVSYDGPKRTRLQRMNTNRCGDSGDLDNVLLDRLLVDLMKHGDAWPFLKPVTRAEAPDYHDIVKTPMDLGTIKYKLNSMVYTCNQELLADLHLVFENCFNYNSPNTNIYKAGDDLKSYCERRCSKSGIQFSEPSTS